jgi:hypothetical protein
MAIKDASMAAMVMNVELDGRVTGFSSVPEIPYFAL